MSADHLELLIVFWKKENFMKVAKGFQKYRFYLVWKVYLHTIH